MNFIEIRWNPMAVVGIPVVTVGISLAVVAANCNNMATGPSYSVGQKAGCIVGNMKLLDPSNMLSNVSASGASGTQVNMGLVPSLNSIEVSHAFIDLSKILLPTSHPLQSVDYLA